MTWNHRVIRKKDGRGEVYLGIHEAFYYAKRNKTPHSVTMAAVDVMGETVEELKQTLEWMLKSLDKPILDYDKIGKPKKKKK